MIASTTTARPSWAEGVLNFLQNRRSDLDIPQGMEFQILPVDESPAGYLDNIYRMRLDSPERASGPAYCLDEGAAKIGATGWCYLDKRSKWVGFDFDKIVGHATGVGVTDDELERVKQAAKDLPYVEVRHSTGGEGLHLYVRFAGDGIPTANHTIHAALARVILTKMGQDTAFDFAGAVDVCGGNMWIWSRTANEHSFALLKAAVATLSEDDLPENWIDQHVTKSGAIRVDVGGSNIALDAKHKAIIERLRKSGYTTIWCEEQQCLQTHTCALQAVEHDGEFFTVSPGTDKGEPNCFGFPLEDGGFRFSRFGGRGKLEHESWVHGEKWTHTKYNVPLDYADAIGRLPLVESSKGHHATFEQVAEIARLSGCLFTKPEVAAREIIVIVKKDGYLLRMPMAAGETLAGWARHETTRDKSWEVVIKRSAPLKAKSLAVATESGDSPRLKLDQLRHAFLNGKAWGWYRRIRDSWRSIPRADARATIISLYTDTFDNPDKLLADYQGQSRDIVTLNFGVEEPSDTEWNLYGARFRYIMADHDGETKHFDMVLAHLGRYLDPYVRADKWCKDRGIKSGAQYLLVWIAIMVQKPDLHLPWLFLVGPQDHGKSALADMLFVLFLSGARNVDKAFTRGNNFDEEFAGTILAVISETSLTFPIKLARKNYNRIKQVTVADEVEVEKKGCDAQRFPNQSHFIQESNYYTDCPIVDDDDTRIVVIEAPALPDTEMVGDSEMSDHWRAEASNFIRKIMTLDLAPFHGGWGKLALPCLHTAGKQRVISEVAKILSEDNADQPFVALACDLQPQLVTLAEAGKLDGVEASAILSMLKFDTKHEWAKDARNVGRMLVHLDPTLLSKVHRRRRYWITVSHLRSE